MLTVVQIQLLKPAGRPLKVFDSDAAPLSRQVLFILQDLRSLAGSSDFLLPALHTTRLPIS